ncbi:MAG: GNAT family N-acetyltransferase [Chloroflexota bacterium]
MTDLTFRKVDHSNYRDVLKLTVSDEQKNFVAPNDRSLLQSAYEAPDASTPYGVYDGVTLVGFLLITTDDENEKNLWVWRFMIDANHQGKGYGKRAMTKLIQETKASGTYDYLRLSYVPTNERAKHVYASVGFVEVGIKEEFGGEMEAVVDLRNL